MEGSPVVCYKSFWWSFHSIAVVQDMKGRKTDRPFFWLSIIVDWRALSLHWVYRVMCVVLGTFVHYSTLRVVCPNSCMQLPYSNFILAFNHCPLFFKSGRRLDGALLVLIKRGSFVSPVVCSSSPVTVCCSVIPSFNFPPSCRPCSLVSVLPTVCTCKVH